MAEDARRQASTKVSVMFLRLPATSAAVLTKELAQLYADGWRVVSHADAHGEYSFVLERDEP